MSTLKAIKSETIKLLTPFLSSEKIKHFTNTDINTIKYDMKRIGENLISYYDNLCGIISPDKINKQLNIPELSSILGFIHYVCNNSILQYSGESMCVFVLDKIKDKREKEIIIEDDDDTPITKPKIPEKKELKKKPVFVFSEHMKKYLNSIIANKQYKEARYLIISKFADTFVDSKYKDAFCKYVEYMSNESRLDFLNQLQSMTPQKRESKLEDMFEDDLEDLGKEMFDELVEDEKTDHSDLLNYKTNMTSKLIIFTAFSKKLQEAREKGIKLNPLYIKYSGVDVITEKEEKNAYKHKIWNGFFNYIIANEVLDGKEGTLQFINNLFDPEFTLY